MTAAADRHHRSSNRGCRITAEARARRRDVGRRRGGGVFVSIVDASEHMARLSDTCYEPRPANRGGYDTLYGEYLRLHDLFGRGGDDVMRTVRQLRRASS